jgi:hypothetical protein
MRKTVKAFLMLGLVLGFVFSLNSSSVSAVQMKREVLDGGGAMWLSTTHYKLSSSLAQSLAGVQGGPIKTLSKTLYTGFWNPWVVQMTPVEWEDVNQAELPREFDLRQNYPNPFNPTTVIQYALPKTSEVKIQIYNILGQKVRNLVDEPQKPGYKMIHWDGKDDSGKEVSSGVYFYRIEAGNFVKCKKMILLK